MIRYNIGNYQAQDSMSALIGDNYPMIFVMSRFGIDFGFGEATIQEVCNKSNIDTNTFLAVVNTMIEGETESAKVDFASISLPQLVEYLSNAHSYFLEYRLPNIRESLMEAIDNKSDLSIVIMGYFDEYVAEVNKLMMYEEKILFPYIASTLKGECTEEYNAELFSKNHDHIELKLTELKNILIKYYPSRSTNELGRVLYDIFSCEQDLSSHNSIEDLILVPALKLFEQLNK